VSAGIPGLGLGGLFFVLSALLAPVLELVPTLRGRSSVARWRAIGRQFALALAMVIALDATLRAVVLVGSGFAADAPVGPTEGGLLALAGLPFLGTCVALTMVVGGAKGYQLYRAAFDRGGGKRGRDTGGNGRTDRRPAAPTACPSRAD
jgi:hypothetical protein